MTDAQAKPLSAEEIEGVRAAIKCGGYHDGMNVHRMFATIEALTAKHKQEIDQLRGALQTINGQCCDFEHGDQNLQAFVRGLSKHAVYALRTAPPTASPPEQEPTNG